MHARAVFLLTACCFARLQRCDHIPRRKAYGSHLFVTPNGHIQARGQSIGHGYADPMQTAGERICAAVSFIKLTARMQACEHDFQHRHTFLRVYPDRNPAPIVLHTDGTIGVLRHRNTGTKSAQRLIGRIVYRLLDDVQRIFRAGIHARPLFDRLQAFEYAYVGF